MAKTREEIIEERNKAQLDLFILNNNNIVKEKEQKIYAALGSIDKFNIMLENNEIDFKMTDSQGNNIFLLAAREGKKEIVDALIYSGADLEVRNERGNTPLYLAVKKGHFDIAKTLIEWKSKLDIEVKYGDEPLLLLAVTQAIKYQQKQKDYNLEVIKLISKNGGMLNNNPNYDENPLFLAAENGNLDIVKILIENGAKVNTTNRSNETALTYAVKNKHMDVVKYLVDKGASVNISPATSDTYTPLVTAIRNNDVDIVKFLLIKNASVHPYLKNLTDNGEIKKLLQTAEIADNIYHLEKIKVPIKKGEKEKEIQDEKLKEITENDNLYKLLLDRLEFTLKSTFFDYLQSPEAYANRLSLVYKNLPTKLIDGIKSLFIQDIKNEKQEAELRSHGASQAEINKIYASPELEDKEFSTKIYSGLPNASPIEEHTTGLLAEEGLHNNFT